MWWGLALLGVLVALPFVAEALRRGVSVRHAPGAFVDLPMGRTHYRWTGDEDAPVAICVHGLTTPSYVFAGTERALETLGYRVLTYDLYGRGFSANAGGAQTVGFHIAQLRALMDHLEIQEPIVLLGFSMGGTIVSAFAARHPDRVSHVVLMAPAGLAPVYDDWKARLWSAPVVGDWLARVFGGWQLRRELSGGEKIATIIPDLVARQMAETRRRGFLPAVLSSRRHALREPQAEAHRQIAAMRIPVLAIWGSDDTVIPKRSMAVLAECNAEARHEEVPGADHFLPQSHPAQVAEALRKFLTLNA